MALSVFVVGCRGNKSFSFFSNSKSSVKHSFKTFRFKHFAGVNRNVNGLNAISKVAKLLASGLFSLHVHGEANGLLLLIDLSAIFDCYHHFTMVTMV